MRTPGMDAPSIRFLENLRQMEVRLGRAQREVATGKRIVSSSDGPDTISTLLQARADLARLEQTQTNLVRIKSETDGAEQALQNAVRLFDEVRALGTSGANGFQTALTRQGIAGQVGSLLERMVALANTNVGGRFVFSGDRDIDLAFNPADLGQNPPWGAYLGAPATRQAVHPTGVLFQVGMTAEDIFNNADPAKNVFAGIENLRQALLANDDAAILSALAPLAGICPPTSTAALELSRQRPEPDRRGHGHGRAAQAPAGHRSQRHGGRRHHRLHPRDPSTLMYQREASLRMREVHAPALALRLPRLSPRFYPAPAHELRFGHLLDRIPGALAPCPTQSSPRHRASGPRGTGARH
jgi:flagellar hook-associated protein 3 FlgL